VHYTESVSRRCHVARYLPAILTCALFTPDPGVFPISVVARPTRLDQRSGKTRAIRLSEQGTRAGQWRQLPGSPPGLLRKPQTNVAQEAADQRTVNPRVCLRRSGRRRRHGAGDAASGMVETVKIKTGISSTRPKTRFGDRAISSAMGCRCQTSPTDSDHSGAAGHCGPTLHHANRPTLVAGDPLKGRLTSSRGRRESTRTC
jgi:hypothetical protein